MKLHIYDDKCVIKTIDSDNDKTALYLDRAGGWVVNPLQAEHVKGIVAVEALLDKAKKNGSLDDHGLVEVVKLLVIA